MFMSGEEVKIDIKLIKGLSQVPLNTIGIYSAKSQILIRTSRSAKNNFSIATYINVYDKETEEIKPYYGGKNFILSATIKHLL